MTMAGKGGGILYVPLLTLFGLQLNDAISSSQLIIVFSAVASFLVFRKSRVVDWKLILISEPFTVVASFCGAYISSSIPDNYIKSLFIISLILPLIFMFKKIKRRESHSRFVIHRTVGEFSYSFNFIAAIMISVSAGFISGVTGIAGGSVKVPLFIGLCSLPPIVAIGSSSIMILITALGSVSGQFMHSNLDIFASLPFAACAILGNFIGSKFSIKLKPTYLKALIVSSSLLAIILMIIV